MANLPKDGEPYSADRSLYGKLRRRLARAVLRKPARLDLRRPLITFSFDDAPASAAHAGAQILKRHGLRGTYFISAGLMGRESHLGAFARVDEVKALHAAGHEIACHTFSHLDCGKASGGAIAADLDRNAQVLKQMGLPACQTFAYPYGDVSPQAKALIGQRFLSGRALHHGLIASGADLNQAPAVGIEGACGEQTAREWMERARAERAWLVLYTHDVRDNPSSWGCTPEVFERLVTRALDMRFEVVTFANGVRRALGEDAAERAA